MSEGEGLHHFKFMYQRFLTSTLGWTEAEQGAYMRLLIVQFDQGGIPSDLESIGAISPMAKKIWHKKLASKFKHINEDGTLFNKVMAGIREDARGKIAINQENGKKGGRPKKNPTVILEKPNGFKNKTEGVTETKPIPVTSNHKPFKEKIEKEIWNQYPTAETPIEIADAEIQTAVEFVLRVKQFLLTIDRARDFWAAFRLNLSGDFYQDRGKLIQHFRNWLKDRDFTQIPAAGNTSVTPILTAREKRDQELHEKEFGTKKAS